MSHFLPSSQDASAGVGGAAAGPIGQVVGRSSSAAGCASSSDGASAAGRSVPCSCSADKMAVCQRYRQNGLKDKATMEDEIRAIRLEIEGKRDEWKQLAGKEQDRLLSLAPP